MITESSGARTSTIVAVAVAAGLIAVSFGWWAGQRSGDASVAQPRAEADAWQAAVFYPEPRPVAPFTLVDGDGAPFAAADLEGAWDLVFFGFTHCPDVCPNTLAVLRDTNRRLAAAGHAPPRVTLISVDPERDEPAVMRDYVAFFDPAFRAATGEPATIEAVARSLGAAFFVEEHAPGAAAYAVDHSAAVMIVDPQGRLVGQLRPPADAAAYAADLARLTAG